MHVELISAEPYIFLVQCLISHRENFRYVIYRSPTARACAKGTNVTLNPARTGRQTNCTTPLRPTYLPHTDTTVWRSRNWY